MNYTDVEQCITKEIFNNNKVEEMHRTNANEHIITVRKKVNNVTIDLQRRGKIRHDDKTIITGLTDKNKTKTSPRIQVRIPLHVSIIQNKQAKERRNSTEESTTSEIDQQ